MTSRDGVSRLSGTIAGILLALALCHCGGEPERVRAIAGQGGEGHAGDVHDGDAHGREAHGHEVPDREVHGNEGRGEEAHAGHDHGAGHAAAAGLSLDELFAARCEHEIPTHQCDECRYELGLVKVDPDLTARGLISTARVEEREFAGWLALNGEVQFDERRLAHLAPPATGTIRRVLVDLGDRVAAGAVLIELGSPELAEAEAGYLEALAAERVAAQAYARHEELRAARITSEREYAEARQQREASSAQAQSARVRLLRLGLTDDEISTLAGSGHAAAEGLLRLRAPLAGQVLELHAGPGERVEAGAEILLMADLGSLWIWVDLYESDLAAVTAAQRGGSVPATVSVGAYPGESFPGRIDFVAGVMAAETRTVRARVSLENPDGRLRPGMFAQVRLALGAGTRAPALPRAAVLSDEGADFAFLHCREQYFLRRAVVTGRANDGHIEIASGLSPGDVVAVDGAFLLKSDVLREKMGAGCAD